MSRSSLTFLANLVGVSSQLHRLSDSLARVADLIDEDVEEASVGRSGAWIRRKRKVVDEDLHKARASLPRRAEPKPDFTRLDRETAVEDEVLLLAAINPSAAIATASAALEQALRDALQHYADADHDSHDLYRMGFGGLIRECESLGLLDQGEAESARYLSLLRNLAVHQGVATEDQALEFADLANRIAIAARLGAGQIGLDHDDPI